MEIQKFTELMDLAERLKDTPRHSWTSRGRREAWQSIAGVWL